jgi:Zn-dependent peptidase ImmA (M78 family)
VTGQLYAAMELDLQPSWKKNVPEGKPTAKSAQALRAFFDDWFQARRAKLELSGTDEQQFLAGLRLFLETQGSIVRINDAPPEDYLGFYLQPESGFATIFVNRKISAPKAQLFTLLHEYGHRLLNMSGISNPFVVRNDIERSCNQFAAEFLAPEKAFTELAGNQARADRNDVYRLIAAVSRGSLLSMHATAIRLVETGYLSQAQLKAWEAQRRALAPKELKNEEKDLEADSPQGGAVHAKQLGEIGYFPTYVAKIAVERKIIDGADVQAGIGLAASLQEKAFSLAVRRFEAAAG